LEKTVAKSLKLFEHICQLEAPAGITDLANKFRLQKSNVHRLLTTLLQLGYLKQSEDGRYGPTLKAWELGMAVLSRLDFLQIAKPYLRELNRKTGESTYLAALDGTNVIYLDVIESTHPIRINAAIGGSGPAYCSASGKVLLAHHPRTFSEVMSAPLTSYTPRTPIRKADLEKLLANVLRQGYAINDGEWLEGIAGVAAPVHSGQERGVAAIGVTGPRDRIYKISTRRLASLVTEAAARISSELGYREGRR
jgi:DNA-binding IclR family transcriptional regulator